MAGLELVDEEDERELAVDGSERMELVLEVRGVGKRMGDHTVDTAAGAAVPAVVEC